jgi:hypothetical protein
MASPFLLRHLALLLLATANLGVSVVVLTRAPVPAEPLWLGIALRGGSVLYATASLLTFVVVASFFFFLEVAPDARTCWARHASWETIRPGMKREEVLRLLGPPWRSGESLVPGSKEQLEYRLHALGPLDEGAVFLDADGAVVSTLPEGESWRESRDEWLPRGQGRMVARDALCALAWVVAFAAILVLAAVALLPFGATSFRSWTLYTPLVALLFGGVYELARAPGGWRFDLFLMVPAYLVIAVGWLVRLVLLLRRS